MLRRSVVYVATSETVGHDLVFRHYTNKVVVGKYSEAKIKSRKKVNGIKGKKHNID
jgi:hypothetical protein